jgi:hypothetical protein
MNQRARTTHRLQSKIKEKQFQKESIKLHTKRIYLHSTTLWLKVLGLQSIEILTFKRRKLRKTTRKLSLCHLSILFHGRRGRGSVLARS